MPDPAEPLRRTETGYLVTTTSLLGGSPEDAGSAARVVVRREPGRLREDDLAPATEVVRRIAALPVDGVRWSPPDAVGRHLVPGEASAATLMLAGMPAPAVARMIGPLGGALRQVHGLPATGGPAPAGLRRLLRWIGTGAGPGEAARLHDVFRAVDGLLDDLAAAAEEVRSAPEVTCLGAPGGNTVYPDPAGGQVTVLVTDEVAAAPAEWDLGWVLGELLELANDPHLVPGRRSLADEPVATAVLDSYGGHDPCRVGRAAVLRWAVHLHDFAAYVEWADDFDARAVRLAGHAADPAGVLGGRSGEPVRRE